MMTKMQQDFQTYLGVQVHLNPVDLGTELNDIGTYKLQACQVPWIEDYPDPQDSMDLVITGSPFNITNFSNAQVDSLVKQGDTGTDQNSRLAAYYQAEEIAVDQVAWVSLFQGKNLYVVQKYVKGFSIDAQGVSPAILWPQVEILAH
jgi:peptide/nickel transport system substrate-binding protein/oligopeptide transport system substrate-binding protein